LPSAEGPAARRTRLRQLLHERADGFLVLDLTDLRYLTGFTGSNGALFVSASSPEGDIFCTDGRYTEQASEQCPDLGVLVARACAEAVVDQCVAQGSSMIAVDDRVSLGTITVLRGRGVETLVIGQQVAALREHKDADEIRALEEACTITSRALDAIAGQIRVGDSEISLARHLEQLFGQLGAEDRAFPTIVASGPNSAKPHHEPGDRTLAVGDLLVIDCGARVRGYHADMTRTFVVGEPAPWQSEIHQLVQAAAEAGRSAVRPGIALADLDGMARGIIERAGFGENFGHGLGHGTGLEIHEAPMIGPRAEGRLEAETTITVEPGVYLPGRGGVRIEDSLLVTADGHRTLTSSPRDLRIVG
jgi:Xaa-Pro dipeptidase